MAEYKVRKRECRAVRSLWMTMRVDDEREDDETYYLEWHSERNVDYSAG